MKTLNLVFAHIIELMLMIFVVVYVFNHISPILSFLVGGTWVYMIIRRVVNKNEKGN